MNQQSPELADIESMSLEECATLLNEYQGRAQRAEELSKEELRHAISIMTKIRGTTSASAAKRRGRDAGPAPSLDDF